MDPAYGGNKVVQNEAALLRGSRRTRRAPASRRGLGKLQRFEISTAVVVSPAPGVHADDRRPNGRVGQHPGREERRGVGQHRRSPLDQGRAHRHRRRAVVRRRRHLVPAQQRAKPTRLSALREFAKAAASGKAEVAYAKVLNDGGRCRSTTPTMRHRATDQRLLRQLEQHADLRRRPGRTTASRPTGSGSRNLYVFARRTRRQTARTASSPIRRSQVSPASSGSRSASDSTVAGMTAGTVQPRASRPRPPASVSIAPRSATRSTSPLWDALCRAYAELERDPELRVGVLLRARRSLHRRPRPAAVGRGVLVGQVADRRGRHRSARPDRAARHEAGRLRGPGHVPHDRHRADARDRHPHRGARPTRFGQIEVKRGIYPVGGATLRFPREVGWGNAMRWLLTGDEFDAAEALRIGLVQEVVAPGEQLDARDRARRDRSPRRRRSASTRRSRRRARRSRRRSARRGAADARPRADHEVRRRRGGAARVHGAPPGRFTGR